MLNILLLWQIPCIPEIHCCRGEPATTIDMRVKQLNQTLRDCDRIIWGGDYFLSSLCVFSLSALMPCGLCTLISAYSRRKRHRVCSLWAYWHGQKTSQMRLCGLYINPNTHCGSGKYMHICAYMLISISQGCRRFETSVFFSVKINISTMGAFRVGFF